MKYAQLTGDVTADHQSLKEFSVTSRRTLPAALALALSLGTAAAPALAATTTTPTGVSTDAEDAAVLQQLERLLDSAGFPAIIQSSDYACTGTSLGAWRKQTMTGWSPEDTAMAQTAATLVQAEALLFQPEGPQHLGVNGEYTKELEKTLRSLKSFWDVGGSDIHIGAMHGEVIMDDARMLRLLGAMGAPPALAQDMLSPVQDHLLDPKFLGGNHPAITANAFAGDTSTNPLGGPDKIIIGDGLLEGMEAVGLGDVAPRGILAHEYGHHLQYELDLMDGYGTGPEASRELELEADALAGYYLSHPRGERLRQQRVEAFVRSFGETGDCSFTNAKHHGTPNQRVASARWGDELANAKGKKGHVLPAQSVSTAFRAVLPKILAPDAR